MLQKTEVVCKKMISWSLSGACVFNKNGNQRGKRGNRECVWWGEAGLKAKRNCGHEAHSLSWQLLAGTQEWPGFPRGANEVIELFSGAGWACFSGDLETVAPFSHLAKEWCWCESFSPSWRVGAISRAWGDRGVDTCEFQAILPSSSSQSGFQFRSHHHTSCVTLASELTTRGLSFLIWKMDIIIVLNSEGCHED